MHARSALRLFAGLGVAATLVATTAIPAAARAAAEISVFYGDLTVAADGPGKIQAASIYASESVVLDKPTMRFDATDLAGVVTLSEEVSSDCAEESAGIFVCQSPFDIELDEFGIGGLFDVVITAAQGATEGAEGTLKLTLSAPGIEPVSTQARVRVGEGVDLATDEEPAEVSSAPGANFDAPLRLRNAGETAAEGVAAVFFGGYGIESRTRHSNCTYEGDYLRTCTFEQDLAPGSTHTASVAARLRPDTYAPGHQALENIWMTPAEFEDFAKFIEANGFDIGKPGDGPALALTEESGIQARKAQADKDPLNNGTYVDVTVTGENGADLEAIGTAFDGAAGSIHETKLGVVNHGRRRSTAAVAARRSPA
ncbi:hypothetical protein ACFQ1L_38105 [Phytohabitans flavus]|uniref:hypothetical protein n=1 Tax=Phytohabitans flavus TaxID=1076124 RepID=UPI0036286CD9